ncbi:hypothetical protein ACIBI3_34320 [Actinomadura luteofluorescens]|uniref:hypothetical protein n=1 Tax=Actinomadura luteofluorescens TaxID=46163 RepID=UPI003481BDD2
MANMSLGGGYSSSMNSAADNLANSGVFLAVAALYKAANGDASYGAVRRWLVSNTVSGVISGDPAGTPNRLLDKRGL